LLPSLLTGTLRVPRTLFIEDENRDLKLGRIDDPVFEDSRAGIILPFRHQVAFAIGFTGTDHFHDKISSVWDIGFATMSMSDKNDVWLPVLCRTQTYLKWCKKYLAQIVSYHESVH